MASSRALLDVPALHDDLARVDRALLDAVETEDELLTEIAGHLIKAGGKRLRPAFVIGAAAARTTGASAAPDDVLAGGVAVELVHLGSLYHDDVMDEAQTRRTVPSVNARWGNLQAILAGDFLLARASEIAASLGTEVAGLLASTIANLCEGQVRELQTMFDTGRTVDSYLAAVHGKTATLLANSCRIGAVIAGLGAADVDRLTAFGADYGMAFQIVDDVLDVVATTEQLGKPAGNDLVEGVYTLPVLRALDGEGGDALRDLLGRKLSGGERDTARQLVRSNGAVGASLGEARTYLDRALCHLEPFGPSFGADALAAVAGQLLDSVPAVAA
ncbi:MAG: polyprenyl synthetase family protein [Actinomycetota bacterium]|nr:polyprenyl synthetase family protein [Actinomycetota bacterium]